MMLNVPPGVAGWVIVILFREGVAYTPVIAAATELVGVIET